MENEIKVENELMNVDFVGVVRFTNDSDEDFTALWNNKEYVFPARKTVKLIMPDESLENIQEIRKRFAYRWAVRQFYNGKEYTRMSKMGNGLPPTFDERILEPMIERCLTPLPSAPLKMKQKAKDDGTKYKGSKAMSDKDNPNYLFRDESENVLPLGKMPDSLTA